MSDFRPTFLHPKITKDQAARLMRAAKHSLENCEAEYRDDANAVIENLVRDINVIFGAVGACDVIELAFGLRPMTAEEAATVPGTNRHV